MVPPALTDLSLDLQIHLCEFLRPSQIIALRWTCKTFQEATSQRIVWIHALSRTCHQNSLFLPTFPIPDMSVAELEHAATTPYRWIALSSSEDRNDCGFLPSRTTRVIKNPIVSMMDDFEHKSLFDMYLVPGGRYLVARGLDSLNLWDLGYVSDGDIACDGKPTKMWVTAVNYIEEFFVQPTPDGLGVRILTYSPMLDDALYVFEIYPQREAPELAKIAELILSLHLENLHLSLNGTRVVIYGRKTGIVIVWDFMANTMASWSITSGPTSPLDQIIQVTEMAIIILHWHPINPSGPFLWIFQIPALTTKPSLFDIEDLPGVAPVLTFKYAGPTLSWCQKPDGWYSSLPLYFDMFKSRQGEDFTRCKLDLVSDLSNVSLAPIVNLSMRRRTQNRYLMAYRICEDSAVNVFDHGMVEVFTVSTSSGTMVGFDLSSDCHDSSQTPTTYVNTTPLARLCTPYSFCPASARLVYADGGDLVISDFL